MSHDKNASPISRMVGIALATGVSISSTIAAAQDSESYEICQGKAFTRDYSFGDILVPNPQSFRVTAKLGRTARCSVGYTLNSCFGSFFQKLEQAQKLGFFQIEKKSYEQNVRNILYFLQRASRGFPVYYLVTPDVIGYKIEKVGFTTSDETGFSDARNAMSKATHISELCQFGSVSDEEFADSVIPKLDRWLSNPELWQQFDSLGAKL